MTERDRWARLDELLAGALDQPPESRQKWLALASEGDESLRKEVERLLELAVSEDERISPSGAMAGVMWHDVADYLEGGGDLAHPLKAGDAVGSYEVLELIGTGGMGAVYRARDPNLHRDVAIKVLSHAFRNDALFLRRFEREAKLLASLNHPNIGAIYDQLAVHEQLYLVLELVDGPTLADRLAEGRMELTEIVSIACQIAEALEEAHAKGIVHRDLKPGNVKLTAGGRVKVLDFGVAKTTPSPADSGPPAPQESKAPTTATGMILGTASYMSPEQARGQPVDRRTDIWAFGCILYEMLAGRRPFGGTTTSDVLAAVLRDDIDWKAIPPATPTALLRLLHRCLDKEPRQRLQDIGDARIELEEVRHGLTGPRRVFESTAADRRTSWPRALWLLAGIGLGLAAAAVSSRWQAGAPSASLVTRTSVVIGPEERLWVGLSPSLALSPDGTVLAFIAGRGGQSRLYLRRLDRFEPELVRGSDGARSPFFSPDGEWVGFFASGEIRKAPTSGGSPEVVTKVGLQPRGATWTEGGDIVFAEAGAAGLFAVAAAGGVPHQVTETGSPVVEHLWPHALSGDDILFTLHEERDGRADDSIAVVTPRNGEVRKLRPGAQGAYVRSGHLVYVQGGTLETAAFDESQLVSRGSAATIEDGVNVYPGGAASMAVSRNGTIAYLPPSNVSATLDWIDARGRARPLALPRGAPSWPRVSPDGSRLAAHVGIPGSRDIWILDLERPGSSRQVTQGGAEFPVWSPDGRRLAYMTRRNRMSSLYTIAADGSEAPTLVVEDPVTKVPLSWSPQGMLAYYAIHSDTQRDVLVVDAEGREAPEIFIGTPANELSPVFSPDGRWLAYVSDETGRNEVYVRPYPPPGGVVTVSIDGGSEPVWSRDGSALYYRQGDTILAVPVETGRTFEAGTPEVQLETGLVPNSGGNPLYDTLPGDRGLIVMRSPRGASIDRVQLVTGWPGELHRRLSAVE